MKIIILCVFAFSNSHGQVLGFVEDYTLQATYQNISQTNNSDPVKTYGINCVFKYSLLGFLWPYMFDSNFMIADDFKLGIPFGLTGKGNVSSNFFVSLQLALGGKMAYKFNDETELTFIHHAVDLRGHSLETLSMKNNFFIFRYDTYMIEYGLHKKEEKYNVPYNSFGFRLLIPYEDSADYLGIKFETYDSELGDRNYGTNKKGTVISLEYGWMH